ncbi:MAG: hypothetical protein RIA64_12700 [Rhodospirillales bacterium]
MNRQYVIFYWHLFSERDWVRFDCDQMAARGYRVRIIQLGSALGRLRLQDLAREGTVAAPQAETPETQEDILRVLDGLSPSDLILVISPLESRYLWLNVELGRRKVPYVQLNLGRLPDRITFRLLIQRGGLRALAGLLPAARHMAYRLKFHLRLLGEMGLDYFRIPGPLLWGRAGSSRELFSTEGIHLWRSKIVELESFDVAWARRGDAMDTGLGDAPYAVYVDEALRDHPDYTIIDFPPPIQGEGFYQALKQFFDQVESQLNLKVMVALHPKANYQPQELEHLFGDRIVTSGQTAPLIKNASLVFMHNSTSASYAVLYRKAIMFLTSDQIDRSWLRADLEARSSWLNQPIINIDDVSRDHCIIKPLAVDEAIYAEFEDSFLRTQNARRGSAICAIAEQFEEMSPVTGD